MQISNLKSNKSGFSLIEIIITLAIGALLFGGISVSYLNFRNSQALINARDNAVFMLNESRIKTLASENDLVYSVHFEASKMVSFPGSDYSALGPDNKELSFSSLVEISTISFAGAGSDVTFKKLTGKTDQYGSVVFRLKSDNSKMKTVNINSAGLVEIN